MDSLRILALAAIAACIFTVPAMADESDRISPSVIAQAKDDAAVPSTAPAPAVAGSDKPAKLSKEEKAQQKQQLRDQQREQAAAAQRAKQDQQLAKGEGKGELQASAPTQPQTYDNVLGPLWGVPAQAPVMNNIDPALEKQYAKDRQGRLVPKGSNSASAAPESAVDTTPAPQPASAAPVKHAVKATPSPAAAHAPATDSADPYAGVQQSQVIDQQADPVRKTGKHKFLKNPFKKSKGNKEPKQPKQPKEKKVKAPKEPKPAKEPKVEKDAKTPDAAPTDPQTAEDAKKQADIDKRMRRETPIEDRGW